MATIIKDIIKDENLREVAKGVRLDDRKRVSIAKAIRGEEDITYHIYTNSYGQIILDPQVTVPASELWVFRNKNVLASLDKAMSEGQAVKRGSFAKYVKNEA